MKKKRTCTGELSWGDRPWSERLRILYPLCAPGQACSPIGTERSTEPTSAEPAGACCVQLSAKTSAKEDLCQARVARAKSGSGRSGGGCLAAARRTTCSMRAI
ncbi:hypothetical protein VTN00DRAFT_2583 [Thermoascus crustaceus]|uniref:uncharacterized protein n=1 Tax=Thermoascus crustaceus TaxID=5088 RepID=UPI003742D50D